jgi:hypothetical protein
MTKHWIRTCKGRECHFDALENFTPDIEEIAHALSNLCRYTGHTPSFYSVAQHCCLVSLHCPKKFRLAGLLHDATEAYVSDLSAPLKSMPGMEYYNRLEAEMYGRVAETFRLPGVLPLSVIEQDLRALATEVKCFFGVDVYHDWHLPYRAWKGIKIDPLPSSTAKEIFLTIFRELTT